MLWNKTFVPISRTGRRPTISLSMSRCRTKKHTLNLKLTKHKTSTKYLKPAKPDMRMLGCPTVQCMLHTLPFSKWPAESQASAASNLRGLSFNGHMVHYVTPSVLTLTLGQYLCSRQRELCVGLRAGCEVATRVGEIGLAWVSAVLWQNFRLQTYWSLADSLVYREIIFRKKKSHSKVLNALLKGSFRIYLIVLSADTSACN